MEEETEALPYIQPIAKYYAENDILNRQRIEKSVNKIMAIYHIQGVIIFPHVNGFLSFLFRMQRQ